MKDFIKMIIIIIAMLLIPVTVGISITYINEYRVQKTFESANL